MLSLKCSESRRRGTDTSTEAGHCAMWVFSYAGTGQNLATEIRKINRSLGEREEAMPAKGKIQAWPSGAPRSRRHPREKKKKHKDNLISKLSRTVKCGVRNNRALHLCLLFTHLSRISTQDSSAWVVFVGGVCPSLPSTLDRTWYIVDTQIFLSEWWNWWDSTKMQCTPSGTFIWTTSL